MLAQKCLPQTVKRPCSHLTIVLVVSHSIYKLVSGISDSSFLLVHHPRDIVFWISVSVVRIELYKQC